MIVDRVVSVMLVMVMVVRIMELVVLVMDLVVDLLLDVNVLRLWDVVVIVVLFLFHDHRNVINVMVMQVFLDRDHFRRVVLVVLVMMVVLVVMMLVVLVVVQVRVVFVVVIVVMVVRWLMIALTLAMVFQDMLLFVGLMDVLDPLHDLVDESAVGCLCWILSLSLLSCRHLELFLTNRATRATAGASIVFDVSVKHLDRQGA